jgi:hypothetical protein
MRLRNEEIMCPICLTDFKKRNLKKCTQCNQRYCDDNFLVGGTRPTGTCAVCNQEQFPHIQRRAVFTKGNKFYKVFAKDNRDKYFRAREINSSGRLIGQLEQFTKNNKHIKWKLSNFNGIKWSKPRYILLP